MVHLTCLPCLAKGVLDHLIYLCEQTSEMWRPHLHSTLAIPRCCSTFSESGERLPVFRGRIAESRPSSEPSATHLMIPYWFIIDRHHLR